MRIAILSDTHLPRGDRRLQEGCVEELREADLILHAGDLIELLVLRELERHGEVVAVHGNVDAPDVRARLPEAVTIDAAGATIGLIHDGGPTRGRLERLRRRFPDADAVVFGHSHLPLCERTADGFQIFNPGSPTERRRAPRRTMGRALAQSGEIEFQLIVLD